jgi:hypothetical protein
MYDKSAQDRVPLLLQKAAAALCTLLDQTLPSVSDRWWDARAIPITVQAVERIEEGHRGITQHSRNPGFKTAADLVNRVDPYRVLASLTSGRKSGVQIGSPTLRPPHNDERRMEVRRRPCNDAYSRANAPAGNLQRRVFPLTHYGAPRYPAQCARYAILQIGKNAAPVITMPHDEPRAYQSFGASSPMFATFLV